MPKFRAQPCAFPPISTTSSEWSLVSRPPCHVSFAPRKYRRSFRTWPRIFWLMPSPVGVVSYIVVASYVVPDGSNFCPVMATATPSPRPCQVIINDAQASSISNTMGLFVVTIHISTSQTPSSTPSTSQKSSLSTTSLSSTLVNWTTPPASPIQLRTWLSLTHLVLDFSSD